MHLASMEQKDIDTAWLVSAVFLRISIPWSRIGLYFCPVIRGAFSCLSQPDELAKHLSNPGDLPV